MFLQTVGLLPDNVIVLSTSRTKAEERIKDKLTNAPTNERENLARLSVDETELNLAAVKEIYKGFYCDVNSNEKKTDSLIEEIAVRILRKIFIKFFKILLKFLH
jgi:hypothetical protein